MAIGHIFKVGDQVRVKSGRLYKITDIRTDDHRDFKGQPGYDARQFVVGKFYGPVRIFPQNNLTPDRN